MSECIAWYILWLHIQSWAWCLCFHGNSTCIACLPGTFTCLFYVCMSVQFCFFKYIDLFFHQNVSKLGSLLKSPIVIVMVLTVLTVWGFCVRLTVWQRWQSGRVAEWQRWQGVSVTGLTAMTIWQGGRMTEVTGWQNDRGDSVSGWIFLSVVCCVSKTHEVAGKTLQQLIPINKT